MFIQIFRRYGNFKFIFCSQNSILIISSSLEENLQTVGVFFKYFDTVNVDLIDSKPPDEIFSHITSSKNESLKHFCNMTSKTTLYFFNKVNFGWSICLGELEVGNPSRDRISLSEITSTGGFNLEHIWHFFFYFYYSQEFFYVCWHSAYYFSPFKPMWHIS